MEEIGDSMTCLVFYITRLTVFLGLGFAVVSLLLAGGRGARRAG